VLPHAAERIDYYKKGLIDPIQGGWHVQQSVVALGTGGFLGVGLGESTQKFGPLPAAHTDGVFAILGEELGILGCLLVILLFGLLTWRGIKTALNARDGYGFLLALGITCWLAFQALINMAVIVAIFPFTGMPLPFLSYGGSSMAISLIGVAILLNISRDAALNVKVQGRKPIRETIREDLGLRRRNGRAHLSSSVRRR
jgi:cell division protein FtsW